MANQIDHYFTSLVATDTNALDPRDQICASQEAENALPPAYDYAGY